MMNEGKLKSIISTSKWKRRIIRLLEILFFVIAFAWMAFLFVEQL